MNKRVVPQTEVDEDGNVISYSELQAGLLTLANLLEDHHLETRAGDLAGSALCSCGNPNTFYTRLLMSDDGSSYFKHLAQVLREWVRG